MEERNLRLPEVTKTVGLSKTEIYRRIKAETFPKQIRLSQRVAVWRLSDIQNWLRELA